MKTTSFLTIMILFILCSCNSAEKTNAQKVNFGIYETIKIKDLPSSIIDSLKTKNIKLEKDEQQPIIGYILKSDSGIMKVACTKENIKLVKTAYPIDKEGKYYAIVALKGNPVISNSDIQKTKGKNQNVEIYFKLDGAKKWANLTKNSIGNAVAFIIDDQIYTMPKINAEIKNGAALINGLENETLAKKISTSLNSSISN
jgi:preprotein translocase subunit SecD